MIVFRWALLVILSILPIESELVAQDAAFSISVEPFEVKDARIIAGEISAGERRAEFSVTLEPEKRFRIIVFSDDEGLYDPYVSIFSGARLITEDDDSGFGLSAAAYVAVDATQNLKIEVRPADSIPLAVNTAFSVLIYEVEDEGMLSLIGSVGTRLDEPKGVVRFPSQPPGAFVFEGKAGEVWSFSLTSEAVDPVLEVLSASDGEDLVLAFDDDGGEGLNSRLNFKVLDDGDYRLRAASLGQETGILDLSYHRRSQIDGADSDLIEQVRIDDAVGGLVEVISSAESVTSFGPEFVFGEEALSVILGAPGRYRFEVTPDESSSLEPVITLGFNSPLGFSVLEVKDVSMINGIAFVERDLSGLTIEDLRKIVVKVSPKTEVGGAFSFRVSKIE